FEPLDADKFARDLATAINALMRDDALRAKMGAAARRRVEEKFSWASIAARTAEVYRDLCRS
ncbi:MAG: glycosyltransferase, partial [Chthoniobacterales bacterium]